MSKEDAAIIGAAYDFAAKMSRITSAQKNKSDSGIADRNVALARELAECRKSIADLVARNDNLVSENVRLLKRVADLESRTDEGGRANET